MTFSACNDNIKLTPCGDLYVQAVGLVNDCDFSTRENIDFDILQ